MPIVDGAHGTVLKGLEKRVEALEILKESMLRRFFDIQGDILSLSLQWKISKHSYEHLTSYIFLTLRSAGAAEYTDRILVEG